MSSAEIGQKIPSFKLLTSHGQTISLQDFVGKKNVVLYFYPKDDTPGCTKEACGLRDVFKQIEKQDTVILGVSPDGIKSHQAFIEKYQLPFTLLSDEDHKLAEAFGVWVEKNMYGRKYMGIARTTFIIGKDGKIVHIFPKVSPDGHEKEVLEVLKEMSTTFSTRNPKK